MDIKIELKRLRSKFRELAMLDADRRELLIRLARIAYLQKYGEEIDDLISDQGLSKNLPVNEFIEFQSQASDKIQGDKIFRKVLDWAPIRAEVLENHSIRILPLLYGQYIDEENRSFEFRGDSLFSLLIGDPSAATIKAVGSFLWIDKNAQIEYAFWSGIKRPVFSTLEIGTGLSREKVKKVEEALNVEFTQAQLTSVVSQLEQVYSSVYTLKKLIVGLKDSVSVKNIQSINQVKFCVDSESFKVLDLVLNE